VGGQRVGDGDHRVAVATGEQHWYVGQEVEALGAVEALAGSVQCPVHGVGERAACAPLVERADGVDEPVETGRRYRRQGAWHVSRTAEPGSE
jgi:hypothetical protein